MTELGKAAFIFLKPYCVELCQKRNKQALIALQTNLKIVPAESLNEIVQYTLFPFRIILKETKTSNLKDDFLIAVVNCLEYIFEVCTIPEWKVFEDIFTILCFKIEDKLHEDRIIAVLSCLSKLIGHSALPICSIFYSPVNLPLLGHLVHVLLSTTKEAKAQLVKNAALECLNEIVDPAFLNNMVESIQVDVKMKIGHCFASFLPGITSTLAAMIPKNIIVGSQIKCKCLNFLSKLFTLTLGDKYLDKTDKSNINLSDEKLKSICVNRDSKWVSMTASKLQSCFGLIASASNNQDWKVRLECLKFIKNILFECQRSLQICTNMFISIPVKLLNDDYAEIKSVSQNIMAKFSTKLNKSTEDDKINLLEILKSNLVTLCNGLPLVLRKSNDDEKLSNLSLIFGYVTLLANNVAPLFQLPMFQKKICTALLDSLELDFTTLQILDDIELDSLKNINIENSSIKMKLRFTHFKDERIHKVVTNLCQCIGRYANLNIMSDYFIGVYLSSPTQNKQAILILNEIFIGSKLGKNKNNTTRKITENFLNIITSPENWQLVTSRNSSYSNFPKVFHSPKQILHHQENNIDISSGLANADINSNTLLICLQIESIYVFSEILESDFKPLLIISLCPLLEKCCDENHIVSTRAHNALYGIAKKCGYDDTNDMVSKNADYVISTISIQLVNLNMFPRCPSTFKAMLDLCDENVLPLVRDTIDEILLSLDIHHFNHEQLLLFLPVLSSIVHSLLKFTKSFTEEVFENVETKDEDLMGYFIEYDKQSKISQLQEEPVVEESNCINEEEDEEPIIPPEVKIVEQVLLRCQHLLSHDSPKIRLCVIDIIEHGLLVLSEHENTLLPMAHRIWPKLVCRFQDDIFQVVIKAFNTVCSMSGFCKQFLRKRICTDILQKLLNFLESQINVHLNIDCLRINSDSQKKAIFYKHNMSFKAQQAILNGLGPLLMAVDVSNKDIYDTSSICYHYLSIKQPQELQNAAFTLFKYLILMDRDLMWLFLIDIYCPDIPSPPAYKENLADFKFDNINVCGSIDKNNVYSKNITSLLKLC